MRRTEAVGSWSSGYFTILGWGLWWKDTTRHRVYYSHRQHPPFTVRTWHFKILRPSDG